MTLFFTSDTHFGHKNALRLFERPFGSPGAMDEALIARWNERVGAGDTVYHLGDVCVNHRRPPGEYVSRLNGTIHLVIGNHDEKVLGELTLLFADARHITNIAPGGQKIILCHYPMRDWWKMRDGSWHLFGHVHGELDAAPFGRSLDVGVDSHDWRPWSLDEIAAALAARRVETERAAL